MCILGFILILITLIYSPHIYNIKAPKGMLILPHSSATMICLSIRPAIRLSCLESLWEVMHAGSLICSNTRSSNAGNSDGVAIILFFC